MKASTATRGIGWITLSFGLLMAIFFLVAGPRAFDAGQKAVIVGVVGGSLLMLVGLRLVRHRRHR